MTDCGLTTNGPLLEEGFVSVVNYNKSLSNNSLLKSFGI